jgi:hypothetical protein
VDETETGCLVWDTGEVKWSDRNSQVPLMLADGYLIAQSEKGELMGGPAGPRNSALAAPRSSAAMLDDPGFGERPHLLPERGGRVVCVDVRGQ